MMSKIYAYVAIVMTALLCGCADNDDFRVLGTIENLGTQNLRVAYANESSVVTLTTTAIDGKFSFIGKAPKETMLEIFTTDRAPLAVMLVKNGQALDVKMDRMNPYGANISGNKATELLSKFMRENAATFSDGTSAQIDSLVSVFIAKNPKSMASTVLLLREFNIFGNEAVADSLLHSIDSKARPDYLTAGITAVIESQMKYDSSQPVDAIHMFTSKDSVMAFDPTVSQASILAFTTRQSERTDSMTKALKRLAKENKKNRLQVIDISLEADSADWHKAIQADSAKWTQAWIPGALANPSLNRLHIPRTPYYIVADSTGTQIYRGQSVSAAAKHAEKAITTDSTE